MKHTGFNKFIVETDLKKYKEQQTQEIITPFLLPLIPLVSCFELSPDETLKTSAVFALLRTKNQKVNINICLV